MELSQYLSPTVLILSALALASFAVGCGGGEATATAESNADALRSVRAQIAKAREEQALCSEQIEYEATNIEVAQELGEPTHNFELLLASAEKCLEDEQLREVELRQREGKLEESEVGSLSDAEYDERQTKCEREWLPELRAEKYPPADPVAAAERICGEWREEDEALGE